MHRRNLLLLGLCFVLVPAVAQKTFTALLTDGPASDHRDKLMTFGQFVGSWDFAGTEYHADGTRATDKGEIHFHWALRGKAIQDVWLETERSDSDTKVYGTTVRFYDSKTDSWRVVWIDPDNNIVRMLTGRKVGSEIVMEGQSEDGTSIRWIFSDITKDAFHWRGEKLRREQWHKYEELWAHRKS